MRLHAKINIIETLVHELFMEKFNPFALSVRATAPVGQTTVTFTVTYEMFAGADENTVDYTLSNNRISNCTGDYLYPFAVNLTALLIDEMVRLSNLQKEIDSI